MTNLLSETIAAIDESGHTPEQITFIGSDTGEYAITWAKFQALADQEYNSSFGSAEVAVDLVIRFADGKKMWRSEYDGSEWWDFDAPVKTPWEGPTKPITRLIGRYWPDLDMINGDEADEFYFSGGSDD